MTTDISSETASATGASTENAGTNADSGNALDSAISNTQQAEFSGKPVDDGTKPAASAAPETGKAAGATPVVGADGKVTYVPNYKYKAALQEKELDAFWHPLIKDADSEKKVKDIFTKVDAFDFMKSKKEELESTHESLLNDYDSMAQTVQSFNGSVARGDLTSAFRLAGITREQVFKWAQQQIAIMEMPADQRAIYEQNERVAQEKLELETQNSSLRKQYEDTAVLARTVQLDVALARPEVAKFADAWDRNAEPGAFKAFVVEEARRTYFESLAAGKPIDLTPQQAIDRVMQRFGKFLSAGDSATQSPQAIPQQQGGQRTPPPVIPNVTGKAASPIKKTPKNLDDLRKLAREARASDNQ